MFDQRTDMSPSRKSRLWSLGLAILIVGWGWVQSLAAEPLSPQQQSAVRHAAELPQHHSGVQVFVQHIFPLFQKQCLTCHSSELKQSGLDLSSREGLLRGGSRGPAIVPANAKASLLYKLVAHEEAPGMPYKVGKLPDEVISRIADWISLGAPYDEAMEKRSSGDTARTSELARVSPASTSKPTKDPNALFLEDIRPVLEGQCVKCHGGGKVRSSGLNLTTREGLLRGGDSGPAIVPGDANTSSLMKRVKHELQPGMPYKANKLPEAMIARIADWINAGAPYDQRLRMSSSENPAASQPASDHWAFQRPVQPSIPTVKNQSWMGNPIDAFIAAEHEKRGLRPLPPAQKRVLLRRVYLDLIGLPPTPQEMDAFLSDRTKDAYEKTVDKLLANPHYGERWGRHWMDVWRYSDPDGFAGRVDYSQAHIWHWRDWIIESLNQDKGYDRMILEMLAGDELAPADPQTLRATGFLARNWYRFNRHSWLQDTADHTALAFLGITLKCARCHEHKYDPFSQEEYYRFRAFFEPYDVRTDRVPGQADLNKNGLPRAYDSEPREARPDMDFPGVLLPPIFAETFRLARGDENSPDKEHPLSPGVPEALGDTGINIEPVALPVESSYPDLRPFVHEDLLAQARGEIDKAEATLAKATKTLAEARQRLAGLPAREKEPGPAAVSTTSSANAPTDSTSIDPLAAVSFEKNIKPILEKNCFSCHKSNSAKSGLVLETVESILEGGNLNGPAIIVRKSEESTLIQYLRGEKKPRMPFGKAPLPEEQIALMSKWIDQLPEEHPQLALQKSEAAVATAEKDLAWARASLPALDARITADKARYTDPTDPSAEGLAQAARKAERQANLLKAEANLLRAQQKLAEALTGAPPTDEKAEKAREKKIAVARKQLKAAEEALGQSTESYTPFAKLYPKTSTGRRLALARWIASKDNPLTARVAVNHIWLRHFGKALVPTVANFGLSGTSPKHSRLLDWLAVEFMEKNWSMKRLHRLMVTSHTYRMQSSTTGPTDPNVAIDPENQYQWRMNPRRMEAEAVRDSVLYVAGQLDTTLRGPPLDESKDQNLHRRSLYFKQTPYSQMEFLKLFDVASPNECYERVESIVPQQALALANSGLALTQARQLARQLSQQQSIGNANQATFITAAFEAVLGRPPSAKERTRVEEFLSKQVELFRNPTRLTLFGTGSPAELRPATEPYLRARENLVHVLFNHNEFVTIR